MIHLFLLAATTSDGVTLTIGQIAAIIGGLITMGVPLLVWIVKRINEMTATQKETAVILKSLSEKQTELREDHNWLRDLVLAGRTPTATPWQATPPPNQKTT